MISDEEIKAYSDYKALIYREYRIKAGSPITIADANLIAEETRATLEGFRAWRSQQDEIPAEAWGHR